MEPPRLHLVEPLPDEPLCVTCGEAATNRSSVDGSSLCWGCFTASHWHPSWSRTYDV